RGHDVLLWAADFGFTESAGSREGDFLRVADIGDVARDAAAAQCGADIEPFDLQSSFSAAAAWSTKDDERRRHLHVARSAAHVWNQLKEFSVRSRRRKIGDHLPGDRRLTTDALHIHDRGFSGNGERLF